MPRLTVLLAVLVPIAFSIGSPPDVADELKTLRNDYNQAQQDMMKAYQAAKTDAERSKALEAMNPAPKFKVKVLDLAKRAKGDPAEFDVLLFAYDLTRQTSQEGGQECGALASDIATRFATHENIGKFAQMVDWPLPPNKSREILATLLAKNKGSKSEPMLLYRLASSHKGWGQPAPEDEKKANELLSELVDKFPDSAEAKRANGDLFELQNLVVGKVFPDFEAKDEKGKSWKLTDYRGKVVVVDFWGFW